MTDEKQKQNLLLDLDENIINARMMKKFFKKMTPEIKEKSDKFEVHNCDGYFIIFERPHLQDFLDYVFEKFNVSVWTAASKDYALFIVDNIILKKDKPDRKLDYVFFSYHCDISEKKHNDHIKDLKLLSQTFKLDGYTQENTFIMDDNDLVIKANPGNCLPTPPFKFTTPNSENDRYLLDIKEKLDKIADSSVKDVLQK